MADTDGGGGSGGLTEGQVNGLFSRLDELARRAERIESALDALAARLEALARPVAAVPVEVAPAVAPAPAPAPAPVLDGPLCDLDAVGDLDAAPAAA